MAEKYVQKRLEGFEEEAPRDELMERLANMTPDMRQELKRQSLEHLNRAEQLIHAINRLDGEQ